MTFQRIVIGLLILTIAGLAGSFYLNWKINNQLQTVKAFVEGSVFAEAVAACEKAPSTTPFKWTGGARTSVIGLNSVKLDKYRIVSSYTLVADGIYCDFDPIKRKADVGSNFLERE
jgi:hypothetical protein